MASSTDGAPSGVVESTTANDQWDSLLTQAMDTTPAPSPEPSPGGDVVEPSGSPVPTPASDGGAETAPVSATPTPTPEPAKAETPVPETPATPAVPEPEPKPFEFTVAGQVRTMDGVYRIPGEGLVVPEAQVPLVQRLFAQAITQEQQVRDAVQKANDLERLTEWKTTGADGTESVLTGREALQAQHVTLGTTAAALQTVASIFTQPPSDFLATNEKGDIVWNPKAIEQLKLRSDLAERDARDAVVQRFSSLGKPASPPSSPPAVDLATVAPAIIRQTAQNAGLDLSALTPEDGTVIAGMLARFQRPATAQDQQLNPMLKVGEPVIDPSFADYLKDRIALRQNAKKVAEAASAAQSFNKGMQPAKPAPKAAPKPAPVMGKGAPKEKAKSGNDLWSELVTEAQSVVGAGRV